jgi:hypothetical protein
MTPPFPCIQDCSLPWDIAPVAAHIQISLEERNEVLMTSRIRIHDILHKDKESYGLNNWSSIPTGGENFSLRHHVHPASYRVDIRLT